MAGGFAPNLGAASHESGGALDHPRLTLRRSRMLVRHRRHRWMVTLAVCCLAMSAGALVARSAGKAADAAKAEAAKAMEMMTKAGQPGPQDDMLKKCEGSWKATVKSWYAPGDPAISEGTAEMKMIMGGRYLEQRFTGSMMNQPFEGYGLVGYDNLKKAYTSFWVDNSSTAMMLS